MQARNQTLIIGAGPTARALGQILYRATPVVLVDSNKEHCAFARAGGLPVVCGSALREDVLRDAGAAQAHTFLALTPNAEVNALAAQLARTSFGVPALHLVSGSDAGGHAALVEHLGATTLFAGAAVLADWDYWLQHDRAERLGFTLTMRRKLTASALFTELQAHRYSLPLAVRRGDHYLPFHSGTELREQDRIILLRNAEASPVDYDRFDRMVARCPVLDIDRPMSVEEFFAVAAAALSEEIGMPPDALTERFLDRETAGSTVIAPGLAIPHVLIDAPDQFHLLVARCRGGIPFPGQRETVHAVFVLVRSREERNFHLRALAAIAQVVQGAEFEPRWLTAAGAEDLRRIILGAERRRYPEAGVAAAAGKTAGAPTATD